MKNNYFDTNMKEFGKYEPFVREWCIKHQMMSVMPEFKELFDTIVEDLKKKLLEKFSEQDTVFYPYWKAERMISEVFEKSANPLYSVNKPREINHDTYLNIKKAFKRNVVDKVVKKE